MNKLTNSVVKRRKPKAFGRITMWIRRIHLYSGLLMFPWVLLYGFTALLFNRPNTLTEGRTEVRYVQLPAEQVPLYFSADKLALQVLDARESSPSQELPDDEAHKDRGKTTASPLDPAATGEVSTAEGRTAASLVADDARADRPTDAIFRGTISFSRETDTTTESLTLDPNSGAGVHRITTKPIVDHDRPKPEKLRLRKTFSWVEQQALMLTDSDVPEPGKWRLQRQPTLEFWTADDGQLQHYRFVPTARDLRGRGMGGVSSAEVATPESGPSGELTEVGRHPRDINWRTYLLRLHMAHGYPYQMNARWFWAITVDLMFACMVFWGCSGLVMWWQIKRTRLWGAVALVVSLILAIGLAVAMHWEMVHG